MNDQNARFAHGYVEYLTALRRSPHTIRAYKIALDTYAAHLELAGKTFDTAQPADVASFISQISGKPATARLKLATISAFYTYMAAFYGFENPCRLIGKIRVPDQPKPARVEPLEINALRAAMLTPRDACIFALVYDCALRVNEAASIRRDGVDPIDWTVSVVGKRGKLRTVPVHSRAARRAILDHWQDIAGEYLLPPGVNSSGKHLHAETLRRIIREAAERAGLDPARFNPHRLRHARAEHLRLEGRDPFYIRDFLGHRYINQTAHYVAPDLLEPGRVDFDAYGYTA